MTGVQSSVFPIDGGQIRLEKTTFVHKASTVSASVYKDGNILKLHFLEAVQEILDESESAMEEGNAKELMTTTTTENDHHSDDGVIEKSEFEENEKQGGGSSPVHVAPGKEPKPGFCKHASFVAHLNDGMIVTSSGFGSDGLPPTSAPQVHVCPLETSNLQPTTVVEPSPPPQKVSSAKSRKKNDEEAKRLEEERRRAEEENEARRLQQLKQEKKETRKNHFHEVFVTCPDGLHVSYQNDENFPCASGGVVVRQRYTMASRGFHDCEAVRWKIATEEKSRCIRPDGTVIKVGS